MHVVSGSSRFARPSRASGRLWTSRAGRSGWSEGTDRRIWFLGNYRPERTTGIPHHLILLILCRCFYCQVIA